MKTKEDRFLPLLIPISNMKFIFFMSGTSDKRGRKENLIRTVFQSPIKVPI